jgi:hypothetical protein
VSKPNIPLRAPAEEKITEDDERIAAVDDSWP